MTLDVRGVQRVDVSELLPVEAFGPHVIGAVRLVTNPGEIFALVVWVDCEPHYRALYWDRNAKCFAYHPLTSEVVAQTLDACLATCKCTCSTSPIDTGSQR